jgi:hypothetical protein
MRVKQRIAGPIERIFVHEAVPRTQDPEDVMALEYSTRAGERRLHRQVGREETDHAVGHLGSELCARLTEEFARDGARRKDSSRCTVAPICP